MSDELTYEKVAERLERNGVRPGAWQATAARKLKPAAFAERQKGLLIKVKEVLEAQLEEDKKSLVQAQEALNRLRHGGGA